MASSRRDAVLREMGLGPLWRLRAREQAVPEVSGSLPAESGTVVPSAPVAVHASSIAAAAGQSLGREPSVARERSRAVLPAPTPASRAERSAPAVAAAADRFVMDATTASERARRISALNWDELEADIRNCQACRLCEGRQQAVPGSGDRQARWLFVGEGPGREEDLRGEPFVGPAGRLLDQMLAAIGLQRGQDVYIANAVKCRPPHNRIPEADEIAACRPYLLRQIELLAPQLIFAMGRPAAHSLLDRPVNISAARGRRIEHDGRALVVSYHPAYLLRNPQDKGKSWIDLCLARELAEAGRH